MSKFSGHVEILADPPSLAHHVAEWMTRAALAAEPPFRIALSGGSTPRPLYDLLASDAYRDRFPWHKVHWFWGDERFVPYDDPASNYGMVRRLMLDKVPVPAENVFPIPTDGTPEGAAERYEQTLKRAYGHDTLIPGRPLFGITLLGLGEDGHTASLLPGQPVLNERKRWVSAVPRGRKEIRITLTYPAIASSRTVAFLVTGAGKADVFRAIRSGDSSLPAARVRSEGDLVWFVDRAAAGDAAT